MSERQGWRLLAAYRREGAAALARITADDQMYYHSDGLGSVRAVTNAIGDTTVI